MGSTYADHSTPSTLTTSSVAERVTPRERTTMRALQIQFRFPRLFAGFFWSMFVYGPATAAVYTVTNLNDSGAGSLRQALLSANANPGADVVDFAPGLSGVIPVTSAQLLISENVAINGPGADLIALDPNMLSRVLQITAGHAV